MLDGVQLFKENGCYSIYRYIDDSDEDGDTVYEVEEYMNQIPIQGIRTALGTVDDSDVVRWIMKNLIKERSNALDNIVAFLDSHDVTYVHIYNGHEI